MVVDRLLIVGISPDPAPDTNDTAACVDALFNRYSAKCAKVSSHMFIFADNEMLMFQPADSAKDSKAVGSVKRQSDNDALKKNDFVGMYLVADFYSASQALEGHSAKGAADFIRSLTARLDYVNLVACNAGKDKNGSNFVKDLCRELATGANPLRPVIAGYTTYVDILYPGAKRYRSQSDRNHDVRLPMAGSDEGRKIVSTGNASTYAPRHELRSGQGDLSQKVYFQCTDGGVVAYDGPRPWSGK